VRPQHGLVADRGDAGRRLDLVVRRHLAGLEVTRTRVQAWIAAGRVAVNGRPVRRPAGRTKAGDVIGIDIPPDQFRQRERPTPEALPLAVLYEDDHLLAVDKPPGIVVHPSYRHADGTLINALLWHARAWPDGQRPSIVGRLDRLTSGIVLVAKSRTMHGALQRVLSSAAASKEYLAITYGRVTPARGRIDLPLGRDGLDRRRMAICRGGSPSLTTYQRLSRAAARPEALSLVRCRLATGRRHQIRVHLAARGWPIVGDPVYGEPRWMRVADAPMAETLRAFPRQALHAWRLTFRHPATGAPVTVESPVPDDLAALLAETGLSPGTAPRIPA
jgi:23S rRNA pseudouridine1911/1915/1917 synthase